MHLGLLGTDYRSIKVQEFIRDLGFSFREDESGRLALLAQHTDTIIRERSRRTAILLAWSLTPVVEPMLRLGCDRQGDYDPAASWAMVQRALEHALALLTELLTVSGNGEGVDRQNGGVPQATPSRAGAGFADPYRAENAEPENAPERYLTKADLRPWHFPDFSDDQLNGIKADIEKTIQTIQTIRFASPLESEIADPPLTENGQRFIDILTKLTRMSRESAKAIYARLNRP